MKIWELHGARLEGAIRSTPDGEADVSGLILSEKAYFLVLQDFRPEELVMLVRRETPQGAAGALLKHFAEEPRPLTTSPHPSPDPRLCRSDELSDAAGLSNEGVRSH